jgi:predicted GTPase
MSRELKIVVIGETGAGKSSLINLFYVWSQNVPSSQLNKLKKVLIKTSYLDGDGSTEKFTAGNSQRDSVTYFAKAYNFQLYDQERNIRYNLTFLDTPGLGDTRGI